MNPAVVLACGSLIILIGFGVRSSFGLFLQPMSLEFGWGREVFSFAMALQNLLWGALGMVAGGIADRYGTGRVIASCGVMYVLGLVAMAFADTPLTLYLGTGFLVGLALSGTTFGVILAVIARVTSPEKRSIALGIGTAAGSMGQFLVLPFAQNLIGRFDWHMALLCLAGVTALIVPLAAPMAQRRAPVSAGPQSLRGAVKQACREPSFHFLFWGYFVCGFQLLMFTVHLPAFVTDAGLKPEHGMTALALIGFCNMIGTTVAGWLGGRFSKKRLLSLIYLVRGAIIVFLISSPLSPMTLYTFAVLMGLTWLSTVPLTYGLVGQIFGMRYAAMLTGIVFFGHQLGSFSGIWLAGYLYDTTGRYTGAFLISIGLSVLAAVVNLPINEKPLAERAPA